MHLVHVGCAQKAGYTLGFEIQPTKRRDPGNTVKIANESGLMAAIVLCPGHENKHRVHAINELVEDTDQVCFVPVVLHTRIV